MSRIGKLPIKLSEKIKVTIEGTNVSVVGPKGTLKKSFDDSVTIEQKESEILVNPANESSHSKAMYGTVRSIINGMVIGVDEGYTKELEIKGVGFRAVLKGDILDLALGKSHPCEIKIPEGIKVVIKENTKLTVEGIDKQLVGEITAKIYSFFPAEPYKGKGVHILGKYVRRKEGKKSA